MFELYINDKIIDLPEESEQIGLEYAIMSIEDIGCRTGAKSYEYSVPKTDINLQAIGFNTELPNTSKFPYTRLKARAYEDGVDLNIRFAELTSINETINFRLYGDNANFYQLLKDVRLSDIDLSDLDHFWNDQTILSSLTKTTGYVYPIIEYTETPGSGNTAIPTSLLYPSAFYREILQRIFDYFGYELVVDLDNDSRYPDKLLFPYSGTPFIRNYDSSKYISKVSTFPIQNITAGINSPVRQDINFNRLMIPTGYFRNNTDNWGGSGFIFRFPDKVKFSGQCVLNIRNQHPTNNADFYLVCQGVVSNTVSLAPSAVQSFTLNFSDIEYDPKDGIITTNINPALSGVYLWRTNNVDLNVSVQGTYEITECEVLEPYEITFNPSAEQNIPSIKYWHNYVTMSSIFGEITCADILKNYCLIFGLVPVIDNIRKKAQLFSFDNFRKNISKSVDWSEKIDYSEPHQIEFLSEEYGQKNYLLWKIDNGKDISGKSIEEKPDNVNDTIEIDNENLEQEKNIVELDFAATISISRFNTQISHIGIYDGSNTQDKTQRVLFQDVHIFDSINSPIYLINKNGSTLGFNSYSLTYFSPALLFSNLKAEHYNIMSGMIERYKKLKILLRLNASDINQLDFTAPVYLQQFESYFYISKVEDYKPSTRDSCIVELVKLNING